MTVVTDYGLAALGGGLGAVLWRRADGQTSRRLWAAALIAAAAAAVVGGTSHGLGPRVAGAGRAALWGATYGLIGASNAFILAGAVVSAAGRRARGGLLALVLARFGAFLALIALHPDFRWVVYDYMVTMAGLVAFAFHRLRAGREGGGFILAGVAVSLAGAAAQRSGLAPSPAFNHNDLFHVLQAAGLWLYYRGATSLEDDTRSALARA